MAWRARRPYEVFTGLSAHSRYGLHVSAQRAKSAVEVSHRSAHPNIPGVPWYAAVLIAVTATAIGYGIDAGHKDLTHVFAGFYIAGCVAAVVLAQVAPGSTSVSAPHRLTSAFADVAASSPLFILDQPPGFGMKIGVAAGGTGVAGQSRAYVTYTWNSVPGTYNGASSADTNNHISVFQY